MAIEAVLKWNKRNSAIYLFKLDNMKKTKKTKPEKHTDIKSHNVKIKIGKAKPKKNNPRALKNLKIIGKMCNIIAFKLDQEADLINYLNVGKARQLLKQVIVDNGFALDLRGRIFKTL
jgi:hypothetical protein